jgi:uncharacterized RDD family membrane protein YckC
MTTTETKTGTNSGGSDGVTSDEQSAQSNAVTTYAGFWPRFFADFLDSLLLDLIAALSVLALMGLLYWVRVIFLKSDDTIGGFWAAGVDSIWMQGAVVLSRGLFSLIYFIGLTSQFGTTLGKRLFRIYVLSAQTGEKLSIRQSGVRCLAYLSSYATFGMGFVMVAFHPEKRGLHDLIAGTICVVKQKN